MMSFGDPYPGNQKITTGQTPNPLAPKTPQIPLAKVQAKVIDTTAIGDGFRRVGSDIVKQQLPGFLHRLLYSIVDVLLPGGAPAPFIGRSNYSGYFGGQNRMPQVPQYGRQPTAYTAPVAEQQPMATRRSFDNFMLADKEAAKSAFQMILGEASQNGYLTVSQVYGLLGIPVSFMGVNYYWTVEDLTMADIVETTTGECKVRMPKAHIIS